MMGYSEWRQFGGETGTSGDDDYPDAALEILGRVLDEGVEDRGNEAERMELLADTMPDIPAWTSEDSPNRTGRLFQDHLDASDPPKIPALWSGDAHTESVPVARAAESVDWSTP